MANVELKARLVIWDDTPSAWSTANQILLRGEIGIERGTTIKMKIGDGVTAWNNLPYYGNGVVVSSTTPAASDNQHAVGTFWIRNNNANTPDRCYYLESLTGNSATWRKVITDQDLAGFAAVSHTHGNITNDGKVGTVANKVLTTGTGGVVEASNQGTAFNKAFETTAGNIKMNGTAAVGSSTNIARADHVHPSDTSKINTSEKGATNGVATLGADGMVPASQLPSYVDDVIDIVDFVKTLPTSGLTIGQKYVKNSDNKIYTATSTTAFGPGVVAEQGVIYIRLSSKEIYRWSGSAFVTISNPLDIASQAEAEAGTENTKAMTALRVFQSILKWLQTKTLSVLGTFTVTNTPIAGTDTVLTAFGKAQGQINNKEGLISAAENVTNVGSQDYVVIQVAGVTKKISHPTLLDSLKIPSADDITIEEYWDGGEFKIRIKNLGVSSDKLASNAVTTAKINSGAVTDTKLATDAVITAKIKDLNVTKAKIASVAVRAFDLDGDVLIINGGQA